MPVRATKRGDDRTALSGDYDVLICGASFAGLAVARELAGSGARVLVLDRYEIGERQTSACAAPTEWLVNLGLADSMRQTFRDLVVHTPHTTVRMELPWTFSTFDYRELCGLLWEQCDAEFETAKVEAPGCGRPDLRGHRPRRGVGAARGRCARLEAGPRRQRLSAARRTALARARGPSVGSFGRAGDLDRPRLRAGRVRLELPGARRGASRGRLVRPPPPRQGADGPPGGRPRPRAGPLPGQLDPPSPPPGHPGRRVLRRRLGRPLPAADRRGHPHRPLLRDRLRARAPPRGRGPVDPRHRAAALRGLLGRPRMAVQVDAPDPAGRPAGPAEAARRGAALAAVQRRVRALVVHPLPAIAHPSFAAPTGRATPRSPPVAYRTIRNVPASSSADAQLSVPA